MRPRRRAKSCSPRRTARSTCAPASCSTIATQRSRRTCSRRTIASTPRCRCTDDEHVLVLRRDRMREQSDAAVRAAGQRRGDACAQRRLRLGARPAERAAAGWRVFSGVARGAGDHGRRHRSDASSERRPQEVVCRHVARIPAYWDGSSFRFASSIRRVPPKAARAAPALLTLNARRRLLRSARWAVRRRRIVQCRPARTNTRASTRCCRRYATT